MKLHLPHSLCRALLSVCSSLFVTLSAMPGVGFGYTGDDDNIWGSVETFYWGEDSKNVIGFADTVILNISAGSHSITRTDPGIGTGTDFVTCLYGATINNNGNLNITLHTDDPISGATWVDHPEILGGIIWDISNGKTGTIAVSVQQTGQLSDFEETYFRPNFFGLTLSDIMVNEGLLSIDVNSGHLQSARGLQSSSVIQNSGIMQIRTEGAESRGFSSIDNSLYGGNYQKCTNTGTLTVQSGNEDTEITYVASALDVCVSEYNNFEHDSYDQLRKSHFLNDGGTLELSAFARWGMGTDYIDYVDSSPISKGSDDQGYAYGLLIHGGIVENFNGGIINTEGISLGEDKGEAYGIYMHGHGSLLNAQGSSITATARSHASEHGNVPSLAVGVYVGGSSEDVSGSAVLVNRGTLSAYAEATTAAPRVEDLWIEGGKLYNAGTLAMDKGYIGSDASVLYLLHGSTTASYTEGSSVAVTGYRDLDTDAADSTLGALYLGGVLGDDNASISNAENGSTIYVNTALTISGVVLNLLDDVTLSMGGNLSIANNVTHSWNGHSLTVDNQGVRHSVTIGDSFSGAWSGAVTLAQTETNSFSMRQEGASHDIQQSGGNVTVSGGSLVADGALNIGSATTETTLSSDSDTLVLCTTEDGSITNTTLTAKNVEVGAEQGRKLTLDDVSIELEEGGTSSLENTEIRGNSAIICSAGGKVTAKNVTIVLDSQNSSIHSETAIASFAMEDEPVMLTMSESESIFTIDSSLLQGVDVSGSFTLDLTAWTQEITEGSFDAVSITFGEDTTFGEDANITATFDGYTYTNPYEISENTLYFVAPTSSSNIPEPTTATLSLFALAGLAARRRRK